jgi:hypothetical protein
VKRCPIIFFFTPGIFFLVNNCCFSQNTASTVANASITVISPVTVSQTNNIVFGNIPVPVNSSIAISQAATPPVSGFILQGGNGNLPVAVGATATASFKVSGQASSAYGVTLPSTTVTLSNGSDVMTAITYTDDSGDSGIQSLTRALSDKGDDNVDIIASLKISPNQSAGVYRSTDPLKITINYN